MAIGIDPTVDYPFKRLFGSAEHPAITIHFLNAVLGPVPRIEQVTILDPISNRMTEDGKLLIFDVKARDDRGRWLNIEMQSSKHAGLPQRLALYAASMYVGQFREGESYSSLCPAISICVLDAVLFPGVPDMHLDFRLRSGSHDLVLTDDLQVHFLELPKYNPMKPPPQDASPLKKWAYFLRYGKDLTPDEIREFLFDPVFIEAAEVLQMIAQSPSERALYEARLKLETDQVWKLQEAKDEGRDEGFVLGIQRGEYRGKIRLLQNILGLPESSEGELEAMDIGQLQNELARLRALLRDRR